MPRDLQILKELFLLLGLVEKAADILEATFTVGKVDGIVKGGEYHCEAGQGAVDHA